MPGLPIADRAGGVIVDNGVSTPSADDVFLDRVNVPRLTLQAMDDPRERSGGNVLARGISGTKLVPLTGGRFLLRQEPRIQAEIREFVRGSTASDAPMPGAD